MRAAVVVVLVVLGSSPALAESGDKPEEEPDQGLSWLTFPLFKGNDDAGFIYGAQAALVYEEPDASPYLWESRLKLRFSTTNRHDHIWVFDAPGVLDSDFRVTSRVGFQQIEDANYFGVGNQTVADPDEAYHKFKLRETRSELYVRRDLPRDVYLGVGVSLASTDIAVREGTLLAQETPRGIGGGTGVVGLLYAGYDSRDHDIVPTRGVLTELYLKQSSPLFASTHSFIGLGVNQQLYYAPLPWLVFAQRLVFEDLAGDVPFYELGRIGGSRNFPALGGVHSQRGFAEQRFIGARKLLSNTEVRAYFPPVWRELVIGVGTFADVSRVLEPGQLALWEDLHPAAGLEVSIGWDRLFIFRMDYAVSEEGGLFYIEGRHLF
jgi:outer membrane protein assembly factor BamA